MDVLFGRQPEIRQFELAVARAEAGRREVLVFFGPAGQGKTELCSTLLHNLANSRDKATVVPHCRIDFKVHPKTLLDATYAIRLSMGAGRRFRKPAFDVAFLHYQKRINRGQDLQKRYPEMFVESRAFSSTGDLADLLLELASAVASHVPFVNLIEKYSRRLADHLGTAQALRLRNELDGLETWSNEALHDRLPALLARDISEQRLNGSVPIVLFDHYEHLWTRGVEKDGITDGAADQWIRTFCENLTGAVCAILSRERLDHWAETSEVWAEQPVLQIPLSNLSTWSAIRALKAAGVNEKSIRRRIAQIANGHPLSLQVGAETYRAICRKGKPASPDDFGTEPRSLIARFLSHLDPRDALCLQILAIPEEFGRELFDHLAERIPNAFFGRTFDAIIGYSFFQLRTDGSATMHTVMRAGLQALCNQSTAKRAHALIFEWLDAKWRELDDAALGGAAPLLSRAASHRSQYDEIGFLRWVLAVPERIFTREHRELIEQALQIAEAHNSATERYECLLRLAFVAERASERITLLRSAPALVESGARVTAAGQIVTAVRCLNAMLDDGSEPQDLIGACEAIQAAQESCDSLSAYLRAHVHWCWSLACDRAGDTAGHGFHLQRVVDLVTTGIDVPPWYMLMPVYRLINHHKAEQKFSDIRKLASTSVNLMENAPSRDNSGSLMCGIEISRTLGVPCDTNMKDYISHLNLLSSSSDDELDQKTYLPSTEYGQPNLSLMETIDPPTNYGLVVNARGKVMIVTDRMFSAPETTDMHVRYNCDNKRIHIILSNRFVSSIDWEVTENIHQYLLGISKILLIRLVNGEPVYGYECSLCRFSEFQY